MIEATQPDSAAAAPGPQAPEAAAANAETPAAPVAPAAGQAGTVAAPAGIDKDKHTQKLRRHGKDVGSSEVQIGLLTARILHLTEHLKLHPKDKHTNFGLRKMVERRKKLLAYLKRTKPDTHATVKTALKLR